MEQLLVMVVYTTEKTNKRSNLQRIWQGMDFATFLFFNPPLSVSVELSKRIDAHIIQGSR